MKDGSLKLKFVLGQIVGASTNAGLDAVYQRMFDAAKGKIRRAPNKVEHGIRAIVFGAFLLEAVCNELYKDFLEGQIPNPRLARAIWSATARLAIPEKLRIATTGRALDKAEIDRQMGKIKALFDLRNRLAHFKDTDAVWEVDLNLLTDPENWFQAPEPELMKNLTGSRLAEHIAAIEDLLKWFECVFGVRRRALKSVTRGRR